MSDINSSYVSPTSFTTTGTDQTNDFNPGRRVKGNCGVDGYKYGWVKSSSYSDSLTTIILTADSDLLTSNLTGVQFAQVDVLHDNRFYNTTEITTISGVIVDKIPTDFYTQSEVDSLIATASGTTDHSELDNLDYASSGHTGFQPAGSYQPSGDYLTETDFSTYSGTLQDNIDGKSDTTHLHDDRYYTESEVDNLVASASGTTDHSELDNLDYASSGHTGFQPAGSYQPSGDYLTETDFSTYSGTLQTDIDGKSDSSHLHDDRYYTESEVDSLIITVSGAIGLTNGLTTKKASISLADEAEIVLLTGKAGWGFVQFGDNEEYGDFSCTSSGVVTLGNVSANFVNTDTDGKACVYDSGSGVSIKNRLGSTKTVRYSVEYS